MNKISFIQITNAIKDIALRTRLEYPQHYQIKGYGFGNVSDLNIKDIDGIYLFVQPTTSTVQMLTTVYNFNIFVLDLINDRNVEDVLNDCAEVVGDLTKKLSSLSFKRKYSFALQHDTTITPFSGNWEAKTAGWILEGAFQVYNGSTCQTSFQSYFDCVSGDTTKKVEVSTDLMNMVKVGDVLHLVSATGTEIARFVSLTSRTTTKTIIEISEAFSAGFTPTKIRII